MSRTRDNRSRLDRDLRDNIGILLQLQHFELILLHFSFDFDEKILNPHSSLFVKTNKSENEKISMQFWKFLNDVLRNQTDNRKQLKIYCK